MLKAVFECYHYWAHYYTRTVCTFETLSNIILLKTYVHIQLPILPIYNIRPWISHILELIQHKYSSTGSGSKDGTIMKINYKLPYVITIGSSLLLGWERESVTTSDWCFHFSLLDQHHYQNYPQRSNSSQMVTFNF